MEEILKLTGVSLTYHSKREETLALSDVNLTIAKGEFFGVVGPSGSGKTTLLSVLSGIMKPSSGTVETIGAEGTDVTGYMLQRDQLFPWRTIMGNIMIGLEIQHKKTPENRAYAEELLKKYSLFGVCDKYPDELSGGMRQRAALIRTLVLKPKIVLLDEPFSALDFQTRLSVGDDVRNIIKNEGITAILVTHDISEAIALCDRVAVLTRRPATVKRIYDIEIDGNSFDRRSQPAFQQYFHAIWKDLDLQDDEKTNIEGTSDIPE